MSTSVGTSSRRERSTRVTASRPVERQIDTMFDDQAVAKLRRGPISTTRSPTMTGRSVTVAATKPSARIWRRRSSSSSVSGRAASTLKQYSSWSFTDL